MERGVVYTIGHSTHGLDSFLGLVEAAGSGVLVDVRRWPRSRRSPWFNREALEDAARARGILYTWIPDLGGYRSFGRDVEDRGLFRCFESEGFRAYATYLVLDPRPRRALEQIVYAAASRARPTVMCSEGLPWRCHRKIIADWLLAHGFRVVHILPDGSHAPHEGTRCLAEMVRVVKNASPAGPASSL